MSQFDKPFDTPEAYLAHYGVKGMKWGVRKDKDGPPPGELILSQECKNGTQLNVYKDSRFSDDVDVKADLYHAFEFRDRSGTKVGTASFYKEKPDSTTLELEWIGVDKAYRSNGYARAALNGVMEYAKQNGITDLEMSATKMGQPLYESLGFTRAPGKQGEDYRLLGVFKHLPRYQLHIPAEVAHSGSVKSLLDYIVKAIDNDPELNEVEHSESFNDTLAHYGIKGMKWGVRRKDPSGSSNASSSSDPKKMADGDFSKAAEKFYATKSKAELQKEGAAKLKKQAELEFPSKRQEKRNAKAGELEKAEALREGKLTPNQKKLIAVGAVAAVSAIAIYGANKRIENVRRDYLELNRTETADQWSKLFGDTPEFKSVSSASYAASGSFYSGLTNRKAFDRPEFVIPKDTIFQRLSNHQEDFSEYSKGVYSTFLSNDKHIYGASGEFGYKKYTISFKPEQDVRVPKLNTVLTHLKQIERETNPNVTDDQVYMRYHQMAGDSWRDDRSQKLFQSLKMYGYSAIVDDMDAGYLGDLPVVFFGKAENGSATPRTDADRNNSEFALLKTTGRYA